MAIYSGISHEKRWFSIVMLVYQRVDYDRLTDTWWGWWRDGGRWDGMEFCLRICRRYMKIWEKWCWQGQWKGQFMVLKDSLQAVRMKFDLALRPLRAFASFPHPVCVSFQPLSSSALPPNLTSTLKSGLIKCSCPPSQTISTAVIFLLALSVCWVLWEAHAEVFLLSSYTHPGRKIVLHEVRM